MIQVLTKSLKAGAKSQKRHTNCTLPDMISAWRTFQEMRNVLFQVFESFICLVEKRMPWNSGGFYWNGVEILLSSSCNKPNIVGDYRVIHNRPYNP